jgi:cell division protease FtsH
VYDKQNKKYTAINPKYDSFRKDLLTSGVNVQVKDSSLISNVVNAISGALYACFMIMVIILLIKLVSSMQGGAEFDIFPPEKGIKFDDIAGMSETKNEVKFAVEMLENYDKLDKLGARPIKGILLVGPPGNGKTMMAKAIAGEAGVNCLCATGADFTGMYAGLGVSRVKALWKIAKRIAPCVIFIDELEAVGEQRTGGGQAVDKDNNKTLNELLVQMDGIKENSGILVIGATNLAGMLDNALTRP